MARDLRLALPKEHSARSFTLASKLPFKAAVLREVLIHRISDLVDASLCLYGADAFVPANVLARCCLEVAGYMFITSCAYEEFLRLRDDDKMDNHLMKVLFGSRSGMTAYDSVNVLTAIDKLDKRHAEAGIRNIYDGLSEFAHPSYAGLTGSYSKQERFTAQFGRRSEPHIAGPGIIGMMMAMEIFRVYYNKSGDDVLRMNNLRLPSGGGT